MALELLLQKKADPNIPNSKGDRPTYYAIHQHDANALSLLILNGATVNYEAIKYSIEMDDIECLHQLFIAILKNKSIIELDDTNDSTYESSETASAFDNEKDSFLNSKIKQFQKDALILAKKLDRPSIELYLSLSPSKFDSVEGKEFIEKMRQLIFANSKILIEKLNDDDFISFFFTNQSQSLSRTQQHPNLSEFQSLTRKSTSLSRNSNSYRSESEDIFISKPRNLTNDYSSSTNEYNENRESEIEYQYSPKFNSLYVFTNKLFSSIHNLSLYFRYLNTKNKALKAEIKEIDSKNKSAIQDQESDEAQNEIISLWANQLKKTNEILKTLDADAITPNGEEFINKWMNTIQKRKEFIENLLNKQIDDSISSSIIEEKKSSISSVLQTIRKCLKSREDHDVIIKFVSSINLLLSRCKSNMTIYPQKFKDLVNLMEKDISTLPQNPIQRTNRLMRGRISSNITQIITDKDKL